MTARRKRSRSRRGVHFSAGGIGSAVVVCELYVPPQQAPLGSEDLERMYGKGFALLAAMGYRQGTSVGQSSGGLQFPLEVKMQKHRSGLAGVGEYSLEKPTREKHPPEFEEVVHLVEGKLLEMNPPQIHGPAQACALQWHSNLERRWGDYRAFLERAGAFEVMSCPGGSFCAFPHRGLSEAWGIALDDWFTKRAATSSAKQRSKWRQASNAAAALFVKVFKGNIEDDNVRSDDSHASCSEKDLHPTTLENPGSVAQTVVQTELKVRANKAGLDLEHSEFGFVVTAISEQPGQTGLMVGDCIREIQGRSLAGLSEEQMLASFQKRVLEGVALRVSRVG